MLIRFRVRNYLSFKDEVEFSMIPGLTRQHPHHIVDQTDEASLHVKVLRAGIVYGANAAGKSNLVKSLWFAKNFILNGVPAKRAIPVRPFKLDKTLANQPAKFEFEIRCNGKDYLYGFEITSERVVEEWLHQIKKTTTVPLFERKTTPEAKTSVEFGRIKYQNGQNMKFLELVALGTRSNQLFLNKSVDSNVIYFGHIFRWFENLIIIYPESRFQLDLSSMDAEIESIVAHLGRYGTGISGFDLQKVSPHVEIPQDLLNTIENDLGTDENASILESRTGQRYLLKRDEQGDLEMYKLMFQHETMASEDKILFDTSEESDGTIRLLDLLPIVSTAHKEQRVYVIDEIDRSLHPNLSYSLIQDFLDRQNHNQIIVTTHDTHLLTFDLLRRDEIWFVEKDKNGATSVYSLEEFTPRYDRNIQKGYLKGRFGAIPMLGKKNFRS